ncbi:MAG TPA: ATP phosphoribosyltransferase [Dehalococcoidia bacterium]|nr:ATP phosphoribosyltransferase [Dehalococcoidia bacterium]
MIKLALPAGNLRKPVAAFLSEIGLEITGYAEASRSYRLPGNGLTARVFREKDIPIQIALGNYDIGICGLAWIEEHLARYPQTGIVKLSGLGKTGSERLFVAAAKGAFEKLEALGNRWGMRIASEFANLAEVFALAARLPGYRILQVAGAAGAYPPEDAELALVAAQRAEELRALGLEPVHELLVSSPWIIANGESLRSNDLAALLGPLLKGHREGKAPSLNLPTPLINGARAQRIMARKTQERPLRLALPDGHQHPHVVGALTDAGLEITGYTDVQTPVRRPDSPLPGLEVKLIRPQDMPQMVAAGNFDIAITGRDCILEHLYRFPSSPIEIALDLKRSPVTMCAVVSAELEAETLAEALAIWKRSGRAIIRIASEFVSIADQFARSNHFGRYQVIPTAGASEGFVPEDAELLIEGTETGKTLVENKLKPIAALFLSTTCVIVRKDPRMPAERRKTLERLLRTLEKAAPPGEPAAVTPIGLNPSAALSPSARIEAGG